MSKQFASAPLLLFAALFSAPSTWAADLNGAWANDASVCANVFVKRGDGISFAPDAEFYGSGVLIQGDMATGSFQKCRIKSIRNDGSTVHVIAACSTGVMVTDTQYTVKFAGDNQMTLSATGPVQSEVPLVRCPL
jgi:hypothetical protein